MADNPPLHVGEHLNDRVEAQVSEGRYDSASDNVRAGLRLLEEQEVEIARLRAALIQGEANGVSDRSVLETWAAVKEQSGAIRG